MSEIKIQTSSELEFSKIYKIEDFDNVIKNFDLVHYLMSLQRLSVLMGNQIAVNVNIEFEFYATPKIKRRAGMLTRDFVSFATKRVLLNCSKQERQYNDLDLANLINIYGNLEDGLQTLETESEMVEQGWSWLLRSTNYQWHYLRFYSSLIARYFWIFDRVVKENKELGGKIDTALGMNLFEVMKIGTCIYANFCPREDGVFADSFLIESYTETTYEELKPLLSTQNIQNFLNIFSISTTQFITESKKFELSDVFLKKYEFNSLKRFPVIKTDSTKQNEQYIIPSQPDFVYGIFEGLYYIILEKLEKVDGSALLQEMGKVFELYVEEMIKQYNLDLLNRAVLAQETTYKIGKKEWRSADHLLISDEYIFQIECKKRKIDAYSKVGIQKESGVGIESLFTDIANELDKLSQKEKHIIENKVPGIEYKNQKIINIIVYLDEMFTINRFARNKIKEKMKTQTNNFYIMGCWEFESVCQQSKNKQQGLLFSIQDLIANKIKIYQIDHLDRIYQDFFSSIMKDTSSI